MKNFLFVQSDVGGEALAGFYSLIATCEMHGINPYLYLQETLDKLAKGWPQSKLEELLPWNFKSEPAKKFHPSLAYIDEEIDPIQLIKDLKLEGKVRFEPQSIKNRPPPTESPPKIASNDSH